MPQESQSKENQKTKQRFGGRRRSYVDTFRWGFVPEEENNVPPKPDTEKPDTKPNVKKSSTKKTSRTTPVEVPDTDPAPPPKQGRQQKQTVKKVATAKPKTKSEGEKTVKQPPKTPAEQVPKQPTPGKRSAKGKGRLKVVLPPYVAVDYDENDEDLKLPSYGRTPIPTDDELPVPQPHVRHKSEHLKNGGHKPPGKPLANSPDTSSPSDRPRREQMVWDPDKLEYVPLVITKTSAKQTKEAKTAKETKNTKETAKSAKATKSERHKPSGTPPRKSAESKPERKHKSNAQSKPIEERKSLKERKPAAPVRAAPVERTEEPKERPQRHRDSRRNRPPNFVDCPKPDPADIEADVSGFAELGVSEAMLEALRVVRYLTPTPIQAGVFQKVQAGTDLMGQARTGTGKTAAFSMPIIEGVEMCQPGNNPVALILVPTRELAVQVRDEATRLAYGRDIRITACYGGKPLAKQIERLRHGIDILVGTPGRILDLMNRRALSLDSLRWVVLDEADRMLDIGFRPDIEKILKRTPQDRQTLLFSATLPPPVVRLAERYMKSPEVLDFSDKSVAVETIDQYYVTVDPERKFDALVYLLKEQEPQQAIIFTRTKRGADRLARLLSNRFDKLAAIHGDLQQSDRDRVMAQVRAGTVRYLVATDVVGRGIDVTGISHIINYDVPKFCDDYVHRVGRTGRMGRDGVAFTFVTVQEGSELTRIEMRIDKLLKRAELKGFESFTKPHDPNASLDDDFSPEPPPKPVFGKPVRKIRRAL